MILVDTSVWSLFLRRDGAEGAHIRRLHFALQSGEEIFTTGLILQELLQGFSGPKNRSVIIDFFRDLPLIAPSRGDHLEAAELRNKARRGGIQVATIDALIAQLAIRHRLLLLTNDTDFLHLSKITNLKIWRPD